MRILIAVLPLFALMPTLAPAQQTSFACRDDETIDVCRRRAAPTGGKPQQQPDENAQADTATAEVNARLKRKTTGPDLSSEGPLSSITDFLPRLAASLIAPTTGETPDFGFKTNLPLNDGVLFDFGVTVQFATVFHQAKLSDRFADSLSDASKKRLEGGLGALDDAQLTGSVNVENRAFGRSFRPHRDDIRKLALALAGDIASAGRLPAAETMYEDSVVLGLGDRAADNATEDEVIKSDAPDACRIRRSLHDPPRVAGIGEVRAGCLTSQARGTLERSLGKLSEANVLNLRQGAELLRASGFTHLAQLVNNQPQLNFSWEYDARRALVGPSQWTGRARFEYGPANMNRLRHHCNGNVDTTCLRTYIGTNSVRGSLARADRVFAQAEFTRRAGWHVAVPEDTFDIRLGSATSLALSAGYGAYFGNPDQGENRDRLDLQGKYDFTRDDPLRQDRLVATLFYTRRMTGNASALFGITWANRPEFVGDVTRKLGANIGFTYKLNNGNDEK